MSEALELVRRTIAEHDRANPGWREDALERQTREWPGQDRPGPRVGQALAAGIALEAGQQRAVSVPEVMFRAVGMPGPGAQAAGGWSVAREGRFRARRMGISDVIPALGHQPVSRQPATSFQ